MAQSILPVEGVEYSANAFDDIFEALAVRGDAATQGVVRGKLNELAVSGTSSPLSVASGWAFVNGKLYKSTAAEEVAVPSPAVSTRIDRIVLHMDYTATPISCEITRLAGAEGGAAPALTQVDGTTWEISLARVSITTGGVITVTDERAYIGDGHVTTASIAADAVTGTKIADDQIDSEHYVDASIDTAHIANNQVTDAKLRDSAALSVIGRSSNSSGDPADIAAGSDGYVLRRSGTSIGFGTVAAAGLASNAVETAKIKDANVTDAKLRNSAALSVIGRAANSSGAPADIVAASDHQVLRRSGTALAFGTVATDGIANDAVDDTKVGNRVPQFYRRQGGSATIWATTGTTDYTPTTVRMQTGVRTITIPSGASNISFPFSLPVAFAYAPVVFVTPNSSPIVTIGSDLVAITIAAYSTTSQITIRLYTANGANVSSDTSLEIQWLAIGPE